MARIGTHWHTWHSGTPFLINLTKKTFKKMKIILIIGTLAIISFLVSLIITKGKSEVKTKREIESKLINDELEGEVDDDI